MRKFKPIFGPEVDLDDPKTYDYLSNNTRNLDNKMFQEIGQALVYMDYLYPDIFPKEKQNIEDHNEYFVENEWPEEEIQAKGDMFLNSGYYQRVRVNKLIKDFAENRKNNWKNIMWFKEQIFLFQEETENMC